MTKDKTPKSEFTRLDAKRGLMLERCEQYAAWTIPSKFPPKNTDDNTPMSNDFQAVGAKCVNNLQNKVMLALFAPSRPFFRPELSQEDTVTLAQNGLQGAALDATLSQVAKLGMKALEAMRIRGILIETIAQLIITGNALLFHDKAEKSLSMFTVREYVVERTARGRLTLLIIQETSAFANMPEEVQVKYRVSKPTTKPDTMVSLYTQLKFDSKNKSWVQTQSIEDVIVSTDVTQWSEKDFPYRVLTWSLAPKRNYGTGMVEEAQGAFHGLSTLATSEIPALLEMCRIIHLADPTGSTDAIEFQNALSGSVLAGKEGDITTPDLGGKARDYMAVATKMEKYERILSEMFLLATGAVRNADRVTAEEIRLLANELETSIGGVYSRLSFDLQQWLAEIAITNIDNANLKKLKVYVITGLDALSANGDLDNLRMMMSDLANTQNLPDEIKGTVIWDAYVQLVASLHNVDYYKFLKSQQEKAADDAASADAAAQAEQERLAAEGVKEVAVNELTQPEV